MHTPKFAHIQDIDVFALETIYADGRALARVIQDLKDQELKTQTENNQLRAEVLTLKHRIKQLTKTLEEVTSKKEAA